MNLVLILAAAAAAAAVYFLFLRPKPAAPPAAAARPAAGKAAAAKKPDGPPLTIVFASQSGTAESFAYEQLEKEAVKYGFSPSVVDIETYDHAEALRKESFVVLLMATFGEGDPTDSAVAFWDWVRSDERGESELAGVRYAVFALGNRQYEHFCNIGRTVAKRMGELGAEEVLEHGEGDDDGSLEDDFADWKKKFWEVARKRFLGQDGAAADEGAGRFQPSFELEWVEDAGGAEGKGAEDGEPSVRLDPKHAGAYVGVLRNDELREDTSNGSTRHIEFDLSGTGLKYRTADNLGVLARNDQKLVARTARRLGADMRRSFSWKSKDGHHHLPFPQPCSVRDALLWYCDLASIPKRSLLETLATYAEDAADAARIDSWLHNDKAAYMEDQKNLLEVLEEVPSVRPPLIEFLEFVPKLQPRFYTISSSARRTPGAVHATVTVARHDKPRGRVHEGVCSTYMAALRPGRDRAAVFVRKSTFVPSWKAAGAGAEASPPPMIMVGPGTGVAPFRAFVREAEQRLEQGKAVGELTLYFGCQRRDRDYIYRDEFEAAEKSGALSRLAVAFSREQKEKVYVQHLMLREENQKHLWEALRERNAYFYVCGGTSMGRDIREGLLSVFRARGGMSDDAAQAYLKDLQDTGRFVQELWT